MKQTLLSWILLLLTAFVYAQTGSIDLTYGTNGYGQALAAIKDKFYVIDAKLQSDGKMLVLCRPEIQDPTYKVVMFRIHPNGTLDQSFGKQGVFIYQDTLIDLYPSGIYAESNTQFILVGGSDVHNSGEDFVFAFKFNDNGTFASDFGKKGKAELTLPDHNYGGLVSTVRHPDGTYYFCGYGRWSEGQRGLIVSLTAKGELNMQFNGKGYIGIADKDMIGMEYRTIALNKNKDALLLTGVQLSIGQTNFILTKLNLNGNLDLSFGNQSGHLYISKDSSDLLCDNMLVDGDDNILFALDESKYQHVRARSNMRIYKCDSNGSLVPNFGGPQHFIEINHSNSLEYSTSLQLQQDGKILFSGYAEFVPNNFNSTPFTMRFEKDGSMDKSYGNQGLAIIYPQDLSRYAKSILHPNGYFYHFSNARRNDTTFYMISMRTHTTIKTATKPQLQKGALQISPNPIINSRLMIILPDNIKPSAEMQIALIDMHGNTLFKQALTNIDIVDNSCTIELKSAIPSGLYNVRVGTGDHILSNEVMILK